MKYPLNLLQYCVDFCKFLSIICQDVLWNKNYFKQDSSVPQMEALQLLHLANEP